MPNHTPAQFNSPSTDLHLWESGGADSAESLSQWVAARLRAHEESLANLLVPINGPRTPENTLIHYDRAIAELSLAGSQAGVLNTVATTKAVRDQAQQEAERVSEAVNALSLNQAVYQALSTIDLTGATPATRHYVEKTLLSYRLAGVDRDAETRAKLTALHAQATRLSLDFARNIQEGAKTVELTSADELDGLPADYIARHTPDENGRILLTTDPPDMQPVMTFASSASLRERMFIAYNTRAYPANETLLRQLLETRQQIAHTLGHRSWAELATADQMMGSATNVRTFLAKLNAASLEGARRELTPVLDFAKKLSPAITTIDAASRGYVYEQYRRATYDFDSQSVRPYFPYAQVEAGVLSTAARLFNLEFRLVENRDSVTSAWHPSVHVFDLYDKGSACKSDSKEGNTQQPKGRFYLDMHPREGKDKWFSAAPIVCGVSGGPIPEAALICNFPGGSESGSNENDPGLLQYSDVITYLHEFGHLMHALLGGHTEWVGLSGFATEGDFIEVPSQMLEEFFRDPALLQTFALHYQTREPLPTALIERMKQASAFGRADWVRTQLYYTTLSLDLHDLPVSSINFDQITHSLYESLLPWKWIDGNRMYACFGHLTGYSSNYYIYAFDRVIALDFFAQFDPANLLDCPAGERYKRLVLSEGGSKPGREMVRAFLGRDEEFSAFTNWLNEEFA
jgi:thimet oligopeptidase